MASAGWIYGWSFMCGVGNNLKKKKNTASNGNSDFSPENLQTTWNTCDFMLLWVMPRHAMSPGPETTAAFARVHFRRHRLQPEKKESRNHLTATNIWYFVFIFVSYLAEVKMFFFFFFFFFFSFCFLLTLWHLEFQQSSCQNNFRHICLKHCAKHSMAHWSLEA